MPSLNNDQASNESMNRVQVTIRSKNSLKLTYLVYPNTTIQEIKLLIWDDPSAGLMTCFSLRVNDQILLDTQPIGNISILDLIHEDYNERDLRLHLQKLRLHLCQFKTKSSFGIPSASVLNKFVELEQEPRPYSLPVTPIKFKKSKTNLELNNGRIEENEQYHLNDYAIYSEKEVIRCLNSLSLSRWNPVPKSRKMAGDLLYLTVQTLENATFDIVCSVSGFYVCQSSEKIFSPLAATNAHSSHTLVGCLSSLSPQFATQFSLLQRSMRFRHRLEYVPTSSTQYPWCVNEPAHVSDSGNSLDQYLESFGLLESARDWNEDLQLARELPRNTHEERIFRDSNISRVFNDFIEAATKGAVAIVTKDILPLHPGDGDMSDMYIHNNIFFSKEEDGKEQFEALGGVAASHVSLGKDVDGVGMLNNLDLEGVHTLGTAVIDYKGHRIIAQSIVPGVLRRADPNVNPVAYGSVDGGKEVLFSEDFHAVAKDIAQACHLSTHSVVDANGQSFELYTSVDAKGLKGNDGRKYFLDLFRMTPTDISFLEKVDKEQQEHPNDQSYTYPHRLCLIRPELVESFYEYKVRGLVAKAQEAQKTSDKTEQESNTIEDAKKAQEVTELGTEPGTNTNTESEEKMPEIQYELALNPDLFTSAELVKSESEEETLVREVSDFISGPAISTLIMEFANYPLAIPVDGEGLTKTLHRRGINMRYLGHLADTLGTLDFHIMDLAKALCIEEMLARAAKHVLRERLKETPLYLVSKEVSHFFNCLFSKVLEASNQTFTTESLHERLLLEVKCRFRYDIKHLTSFISQRRLPLLRNICAKTGIQIKARDYDFSGLAFAPTDILNLYPIVKQPEIKSQYADNVYDYARLTLSQGDKELGKELVRESILIYDQVFGSAQPQTMRAFNHLAMLCHQSNDNEGARMNQRKAVLIAERILGYDCPETLQYYMTLSYFEQLCDNVQGAIQMIQYAMKIWEAQCANMIHPDTPSAYSNISDLLMKVGKSVEARHYLEKAAKSNQITFGKMHPITIASYQQLTQLLYHTGKYREALDTEKVAYEFFLNRLGPQNPKTQATSEFLKKLTELAVSQAKKNGPAKKSHPKKPIVDIVDPKHTKGNLPIDALLKFIGEDKKVTKKSAKQK